MHSIALLGQRLSSAVQASAACSSADHLLAAPEAADYTALVAAPADKLTAVQVFADLVARTAAALAACTAADLAAYTAAGLPDRMPVQPVVHKRTRHMAVDSGSAARRHFGRGTADHTASG